MQMLGTSRLVVRYVKLLANRSRRLLASLLAELSASQRSVKRAVGSASLMKLVALAVKLSRPLVVVAVARLRDSFRYFRGILLVLLQ